VPKRNLSSLSFLQRDFNELIVANNHLEIAELLVKAERARLNGDFYKAKAVAISENLSKYAKLLDLYYEPLDLSEFTKAALEANKAQKALDKLRKEERIKQQNEDLEKWKMGEDVRSYFEFTALRIKNDEIQTTKGARIPLEHGIRAFPLLSKLHKGEDVNLSAHSIKLGNYTVSRVQNDNLIVGCHTIPFSEIYSMAKILKLSA
jgi:hypothetical protein